MTGFSTESFTFLRGLEDNNNRDWFNENKAQFTAHLEQPFADMLEALSNRLMDASRPLSGGKSTMFRMNRDVRFSKDKTLYKTNVSGILTPSGSKSEVSSILYLQLQSGGGFAAAGYYNLSPKQLIPIRDAIVERAERFDEILAELSQSGRTLDDDQMLSSMPRGYAQHSEHRHAEHIRRKSLLIQQPLVEDDWISGNVIDQVERLARDAMPLLTFQDPARPS
jgi:uncharacterized protein (TIGR02453 family)